MTASITASWSSRFAFLMASVGFAVGLGNIWRFPYVTGENGGAAFVLVYLMCAFFIGVPILIAEILIGRRGRSTPPESMATVAGQEGRPSGWRYVGYINLLAVFIIAIVYCVIVGWVLWYLFKALTTGFVNVDGVAARAQFDAMLVDPWGMMQWTVIGLIITGIILYAGVRKGLERAVTIMMPGLFILLVVLVIYNVFMGGVGTAVEWLFTPDFSKITPQVALAALGQSFFSIGVAMAAMMIYGAYLPKEVSITHSVVVIVSADVSVALLAGLVIFPAVFNYGLDPGAGTGLIFQTLPVAFAQMPGGFFFSSLFFLLLTFAGLTSLVGLIESLTASLEVRAGTSRHASVIIVLLVIAVLSLVSIQSYDVAGGWQLFGRNLNDLMDYFSNQLLLPIGAFFIALFAGWMMSRDSLRDELAVKNDVIFNLWYWLIRFVVPPAVLLILVTGIMG